MSRLSAVGISGLQAGEDVKGTVNHLFIIIEAPGKIARLKNHFGHSQNVRISATRGHFFSNPPDLLPLGIDSQWNELLRHPNQEVVKELLDGARYAREIIIATDSDSEGEVIARDILSILQRATAPISRMRFSGLSNEALKQAFEQRASFKNMGDANFLASIGDARRIFDRTLGAIALQKHKMSAGRVYANLLASLENKKLADGIAHLSIRVGSDVTPFTAEIAVNQCTALELIKQTERVCIDRLDGVLVANPPPLSFGNCLLQMSTQTRKPVEDVEKAIQELYECGLLSYPRGKAASYDQITFDPINKIAQKYSLGRPNRGFFLSQQTENYHLSPGILSAHVPVLESPSSLSFEERILQVVARSMIERSVTTGYQKIPQDALPQQLRHIDFTRPAQPLPWRRKHENKFTPWTIEQALLHHIIDNDIGRSSTLTLHLSKFLQGGNLDRSHFALSDLAMERLRKLPASWKNPTLSQAIENAKPETIDKLLEDWVHLAGAEARKHISALVSPVRKNRLDNQEALCYP